MIIRAELRRKQSEYEGDACVVDKVIELPAQRLHNLDRLPLRQQREEMARCRLPRSAGKLCFCVF